LYICTTLSIQFDFGYCLQSGTTLRIVNKVLIVCLFLDRLHTLKGR